MRLDVEGYGTIEIDDLTAAEFRALSPDEQRRRVGQALRELDQGAAPDAGQSAPALSPDQQYSDFGAGFRTLMQGLTFGFGDEVEALIRSTLTQETYTDARDEIRANLDRFRDENPVTALGLEVAGGLAVPFGGIPLAAARAGTRGAQLARAATQAQTIPGQIARGAVAGTATGAVAGLGASEAELAAGDAEIGQAVLDAGAGAVVGGALGTAVPAAVALTGRGVRQVRDRLGFGDTTGFANRKILQALEREGMTPGQAQARLQQMRADGIDEATIADLGAAPRDITYSARAVPSERKTEAAEFLDRRFRGQAGAVSRTVADDLLPGVEDKLAFIEDLAEMQSLAAQRAYPKAYEKALPRDMFKKFYESDVFEDAYNRAKQIIDIEDALDGDGVKLLSLEDFKAQEVIPTRQLHLIKRGLDQIVDASREGGRPTGLTRAVAGLRKDFNDRIKTLNPEYKKANADFADFEALKEIYDSGEKFFSMSLRDSRKFLKDIEGNDGKRQAFAAGVASAILGRAAKARDSRNFLDDIAGNELQRTLLEKALPAGSFARLMRFIDGQRELVRTKNRVLGGSQTAENLMVADDAAEDITPFFSMAYDVGTAGVLPAIGRRMQSGKSRALGITPPVAERILERTLEPGQAAQDAIFRELEAEAAAIIRRARNPLRSPVTPAAGLGIAGGLFAGESQ